ncbi:T1SS-143 repeat domain-containing protein [Pseudomonas sp. 22526]|uniref:T1SS-143 repeat domain-containing protein n=1 Tax=Pseudomonas sp. 22526 TaxID=3453937 RepID=UPI003F8740BF
MTTSKTTTSPTNELTTDTSTALYPVFPSDNTLTVSTANGIAPVVLGASVTLDETSGLQNATATPSPAGDADDNDILFSALPSTFATRLTALGAGTAMDAALSGYTGAPGNTGSNAFTLNLTPGINVIDIKFTDSLGAPLNGLDSGLETLDGTDILLYTDSNNNILVGRAGGPAGAIVFAAYIEETGSPVSGGKIWTVEYQPLKHPDASNPDDALNLLNKVFVSTVQDGFNLNNAPSGQNLFLMFTGANPTVVDDNGVLRVSDPAIIATGKDPADQSSGANINTGDRINTSQGGGPITIGTNNQMITEQEGIRLTFVTGARLDVTIPNLSQNEADVEDNIDFTAMFNTKTASFDVVQLQGGKTAMVKISAFSTAVEDRVDFVNGYANDASVAITNVRVFDKSTGLLIENSDGSVNDPSIAISFSGGVATVTGVKANYQIEYTTSADHNRVLVENGAAVNARGDNHADFDIGGFSLRHPSTITSEIGSQMIFEDDGPAAAGTAEAGTVDEDGLANGIAGGVGDVPGEVTTVSGSVTAIFQSGVDVPLSYSLSSDTSGLPALSSGGVALVYSVVGDTLTAKAGAVDVFTFSLSAAGAYSFTLLQPLDHPAGNDENDITLNLGTLLQATDKDGDTVTAAAEKLVITVDDDTPTATGVAEAGTVDEDGLANGIAGGVGDVPGEATTASGNVTGIFQSGADVPLSYSLSSDTSGLPALSSGGVALVYSVVGDTLTAKAGAVDVFTFSLSAAGAYSFTLLQPLDHPDGNDENDITLNLGTMLQATDKDGDTVTAAAEKLVITVDDDTPTAAGTAEAGTVDEDGLANGIAGGVGDVAGEATTASGNVTGIFQSGADVPLTYSLSSDTSGLPALSSGGVALVYSVAGDTLTAKAGAVDVFTFSLSAAGAYSFSLLQPLDHPAGDDENDISINLGTLLKATDKDGDTVTAAAEKLVITVDDDTPTANGTAEAGTVDEDGLANGIAGGVGDVPGEATTASGSVTGIFQSGADVPLTYSLSSDTSGLPALSSGGVALVYSVAGDTLTAMAGAVDVFTFSLSAAGDYSFSLLQPLDHPAGNDENDITLNLGTLLQATDKDGDTVTAAAEKLVITVDDDTPTANGTAEAGTVDEDGLANGIAGGIGDVPGEATTASGNVTAIFQSGADVPLTYSLSSDTSGLPALSSGGVALVYSVAGDTLTANAGVGGAEVFTFSFSAAGAYSFSLLQPLDHPAGNDENDITINLGTMLQATDKDGDTVTAAAEKLVITVDDDTPTANGAAEAGTVDEDGLANGIAGGVGDVPGEATTASGNVTGIFQSGADVPLTYSLSSDTSGLPALSSGGVALVYSVVGDTLTANAGVGGADVFTFSLSAAGAYSFTLLQPLDHPAGNDENDISINLGTLLQATDKDGDTVTAAAEKLVITVDDDTPTATGAAEAGTVDEDGLANGIAGGVGDVPGEATTASGNVTGIFQSGADVPLTYSLSSDTSGLPALSSGGVALVYSVVGDTLTANAGVGGAEVFTFSLSAAGAYSFSLLQPLDHPAGNDENDISINLGTLLQATDKDGDTVTAAAEKLVITVDDDTPTANGAAEAGTVDEDGLANGIAGGVGDVPGEATTASGSVTGIFQSGADVPLTYSLSSDTSGLPALSSGGVALVYSVAGDTLTAKAGAVDVFTFSLSAAGDYNFSLLQPLDHPAGNDENDISINLGTMLQATDKDGDTVTAAAEKLVITVDDDTPTAAGTAEAGTVDEDGLTNGIAGGVGDVAGEATVASGNVTGIFQSGADVPLTYSLSSDTSGLPALSSGGVALVYSVVGDTLTANAGVGGADVFTFSLSAAGAYSFTLLQPLDHPAGNDENDITLNLGTLLQATDKDGDTVTAAAEKLVITVDDDTPTAAGTAEAGTVDEDGLANGIAGGVGDVPGEATTASGNVTGIFQSGADVPLSYTLSSDTSGLPALSSGGVALVYSVAGDTLTAKAGAVDVFTFSLSAAGAYSFTLLQPLDHPAGNDENDITINLGTLLQATDKDGDTVTAAAEKLVITVDDDTPTATGTAEAGTVDEDGLANGIAGGVGDVPGEATTASGNVTGIFQSGADVPLTYSLSSDTSGLPALSSGGVALVYSVLGDTLTAKAGATDVFTFSLSAAGAYSFSLLQPLDHPAGNDENDITINLGTLLKATDKDGDTVTAAAEKLVITVDDDTPTANGTAAAGTVDEDGLANGIAGGVGDVAGEATTANGSVTGIFQSGADVPLTYSLSSDTSGLPALSSGGVALVYSVLGDTLTAKAGATDVFTFSLSAAGAYSFTLLQPLDHPAGNDENDITINLGSLLKATDKDGDTVTAAPEKLVITVDDDTPTANGTAEAGTVDEDGLANGIAGGVGDVAGEATVASGSVTGIFQSGADVPLSYSLSSNTSGLPALSSGGVALAYSVLGNTLTAKAGATDVFTLSLTVAGAYTFTLLQHLDHAAGNDENDLTINLGTLLQATDKDGDTVTAAADKLVITVDDDTPTLAFGNLIGTGTQHAQQGYWNLGPGADGLDANGLDISLVNGQFTLVRPDDTTTTGTGTLVEQSPSPDANGAYQFAGALTGDFDNNAATADTTVHYTLSAYANGTYALDLEEGFRSTIVLSSADGALDAGGPDPVRTLTIGTEDIVFFGANPLAPASGANSIQTGIGLGASDPTEAQLQTNPLPSFIGTAALNVSTAGIGIANNLFQGDNQAAIGAADESFVVNPESLLTSMKVFIDNSVGGYNTATEDLYYRVFYEDGTFSNLIEVNTLTPEAGGQVSFTVEKSATSLIDAVQLTMARGEIKIPTILFTHETESLASDVKLAFNATVTDKDGDTATSAFDANLFANDPADALFDFRLVGTTGERDAFNIDLSVAENQYQVTGFDAGAGQRDAVVLIGDPGATVQSINNAGADSIVTVAETGGQITTITLVGVDLLNTDIVMGSV